MKIALGIGLAILFIGLALALWFFTRPAHNELGYAVATMFSLAVAAVGGVILLVTGAFWFIAWVYS